MEKDQKSFKLDTSTKNISGLGFILLVLFMIFTGWVMWKTRNQTPSVASAPAPIQQVQKQYTDTEAYIQARNILEKYLKAPTTAKFPNSSLASIDHIGTDGFKITSYVDSQNSYGAMIRSDWTVLFKYVGDRYEVYQVIIDGEEMYRTPKAPTSN